MNSLHRPSTRTVCAVMATLLVCLGTATALSGPSAARAADASQLQQQIGAGQGRITGLAGAVNAASSTLAQLQGRIAPLQAQLAPIQADLDAKRLELLKLQSELDHARTRLAQLEAFQARAQTALSNRLTNAYESDRPDLVSVVLEARGFSDLLERVSFARRIQKQDAQVVTQVRAARTAVAKEATHLGRLEVRQRAITTQVLARRDALARVKLRLVQQQIAVAQARSVKAGQLASARGQVASLQAQLSKIQAAQAIAANPSLGSIQVSTGGGFTFPLPKGTASPPSTWSLDDGVDISAPGNTALLAVGAGTIVLHGIGGFGPSAPVLHLDSGPYVYYGHAGPGNMVSIGTHVSAGQVISEVGAGIVGISTGPHLEMGYCDSSGTPLGPGTAPQMQTLLQGSYTG